MAALNSKDLYLGTIYPRLLTASYNAADLSIRLEGTIVVVELKLPQQSGETQQTPTYVKLFTVKLWRQGETTGTAGEWWDNAFDANNMLLTTTTSTARFNLLDLPVSNTNKRISATGINYQIACKASDIMNVTSLSSVRGSIRIKTLS